MIVHKSIIDSYARHNFAKMPTKFLMWLFVRLMRPYLYFIDAYIQEGVLFDSKHELGFKRNSSVLINSVDYWKSGYEVFLKPETTQINLPLFLRIILSSSFKICKQMEIVALLGNLNSKSNIYDTFLEKIKLTCPFLTDFQTIPETLNIPELETKSSFTLLELNFKKIFPNSTSQTRPKKNLLELNLN